MNIVFSPAISDEAWAIGKSLLPQGFTIEILAQDHEDRVEQLERADFLMGFLRGLPLRPDDYPHLRRVKLIQVLSAGYDGIDIERLRQSGIPLCNNGGANSYAVSEHAILLMLAVYRRLPALDRLVRAGQWKSSKLGEEQEHELAGKTVGIVGAGMIGRTIARRLSGFEVKLLYHDPVRLPAADAAKLNMTYRDLDDLLRESDVVTLHAPSNASTHHLICDRTLALMKREAIIINTARGELIDEAALYRALSEGRIWAAGLDTFDQEPPDPKNPIFTLPNVVLSPHAAGPTWESWPKRFGHSYANIQRVARGEAPLWVVPELR
ncbi:MAG TPA: 2-hydroxyacid dehydrogenase [Burkholderiales bacterium]|jgi:phosphoglycerate dehydrogenase-like enzyme|nr:2-hydroxyacid dehydrogenase [Burkholderiales bacterium]